MCTLLVNAHYFGLSSWVCHHLRATPKKKGSRRGGDFCEVENGVHVYYEYIAYCKLASTKSPALIHAYFMLVPANDLYIFILCKKGQILIEHSFH